MRGDLTCKGKTVPIRLAWRSLRLSLGFIRGNRTRMRQYQADRGSTSPPLDLRDALSLTMDT